MELTEVVSPSVAVPVLCVLVCAFLVFAFGFKSPAQPPSFDVFDDDGKKKRTKKTKGSKGQTNGHAGVSGETDTNNSAKPQPSPRQTVKQSSKTVSNTAAKSKSTPQANQELPKKTKKQTAKEEEVKSAITQEVIEDDAGWHMVPKKDKKQKKKETEVKQDKQDVALAREEEIVAKSDDGVAAAGGVTTETPGSPQEQRSKKKKEKKNKKVKQDDELMEQAKPEPEVTPEIPSEAPTKDEEPAPVAAGIELQIKEAMETTVEETGSLDKKTKNKKDKKKALPSPEEDDFVIPSAISAPVDSIGAESIDDTPLKENTDALTVKVPKKKQKKERNKKNEETIAVHTESGASASTDSSLSQSIVSDTQPKKTSQEDTSVPEKLEQSSSSSGMEGASSSDMNVPANPAPVFDELGSATDSWTEAKPKSKKKKARRAD